MEHYSMQCTLLNMHRKVPLLGCLQLTLALANDIVACYNLWKTQETIYPKGERALEHLEWTFPIIWKVTWCVPSNQRLLSAPLYEIASNTSNYKFTVFEVFYVIGSIFKPAQRKFDSGDWKDRKSLCMRKMMVKSWNNVKRTSKIPR